MRHHQSDSPKHEPLRCDLATILFYAAGHVDKDKDNYCEVTDTEVTCVFNYLLKKNPKSNKLSKRVERKEPLTIPVLISTRWRYCHTDDNVYKMQKTLQIQS